MKRDVQRFTEKKEIRGTEYIAQFAGMSVPLRMTDVCSDKDGKVSNEKTTQFLLDHVIVEPSGLTPDCFEDMEEMSEVIAFANRVMTGKREGEFRTEITVSDKANSGK